MKDIWYTFPATMGEDQAWITYNHGFSEVADNDSRKIHLRIDASLKKSNEYGMPFDDEFPALLDLEDNLEKKIGDSDGILVGRITVAGHRFFYFYVKISEEQAKRIIEKVAISSGYKLLYTYKEDMRKRYYWDELYPTDDDWQVIKDLDVLDTLAEEGDIRDKAREVEHWAYLPDMKTAEKFSQWAVGQKYCVVYYGKDDDGLKYLVKYTHIGTMNLGDISCHTIASNQKARELGGEYDGWETSVEREDDG